MTAYAQKGWPDCFAEVGVFALYDAVVPGGIRGYIGDQQTEGIAHQLAMFRASVGDDIVPEGKCRFRLPNAEARPVSNM